MIPLSLKLNNVLNILIPKYKEILTTKDDLLVNNCSF